MAQVDLEAWLQQQMELAQRDLYKDVEILPFPLLLEEWGLSSDYDLAKSQKHTPTANSNASPSLPFTSFQINTEEDFTYLFNQFQRDLFMLELVLELYDEFVQSKHSSPAPAPPESPPPPPTAPSTPGPAAPEPAAAVFPPLTTAAAAAPETAAAPYLQLRSQLLLLRPSPLLLSLHHPQLLSPHLQPQLSLRIRPRLMGSLLLQSFLVPPSFLASPLSFLASKLSFLASPLSPLVFPPSSLVFLCRPLVFL